MIAYEFKDRYDILPVSGQDRGIKYPLWLVAQDPFADVETDAEGYIVHLAEPRFTARWFTGEEPVTPADTLSGITYGFPDLDMTLCELVFMDAPADEALDAWLREACMAVGHYLGFVSSIEDRPY